MCTAPVGFPDSQPQILLLFVKGPLHHGEEALVAAGSAALSFLISRAHQHGIDFAAGMFSAVSAAVKAFFPQAGHEHEGAGVPGAASSAADFLVGDHMIPPARFVPELGSLMEFLVGFGQIAGADGAIIAADGQDGRGLC